MTIGTVYEDRRGIFGASVPGGNARNYMEWRDALFQRCDGSSLKPLIGAQRHARPRVQ